MADLVVHLFYFFILLILEEERSAILFFFGVVSGRGEALLGNECCQYTSMFRTRCLATRLFSRHCLTTQIVVLQLFIFLKMAAKMALFFKCT